MLTSKINWTQIIGLAAVALSWFGFDLPAEQQAQVATIIAAGTGIVTFILRTWFNKPKAS